MIKGRMLTHRLPSPWPIAALIVRDESFSLHRPPLIPTDIHLVHAMFQCSISTFTLTRSRDMNFKKNAFLFFSFIEGKWSDLESGIFEPEGIWQTGFSLVQKTVQTGPKPDQIEIYQSEKKLKKLEWQISMPNVIKSRKFSENSRKGEKSVIQQVYKGYYINT